MIEITTYSLADGRILSNIETIKITQGLTYDNTKESHIDGMFSSLTHYVNIHTSTHFAVAKTAINYVANKTTITADATDSCVLTMLPTGTTLTVTINGTEHAVSETNGSITFKVNLAGTYELILKNDKFLDTTVSVTAT